MRTALLLFLLSSLLIFSSGPAGAQVTVAQISDTHIGDPHAPHALDNLRKAVEMINERHPDVVIASGDIGEQPKYWEEAKQILSGLKEPLHYVPGNHDVHSHNLESYRGAFGKDYYRFQVKNVVFLMIDSQLLGNFDQFNARTPPPLSPENEEEGEKMLKWLADQKNESGEQKESQEGKNQHLIFIGVQHVPDFRDGNFPPDPKPYWVVNDPYRSQEMKILHELGVKDMLVGHWHQYRNFKQDGITWHVAPATSWLPWGGQLGFAMQTISPDGHVSSQFVPLPDAQP